jgi:hypothetical protein
VNGSIVRVNGGYNMAFPWLVEMLMEKTPPLKSDDKDRAKIALLMATLDEFMSARSESGWSAPHLLRVREMAYKTALVRPFESCWLSDEKSVSLRGRASGAPARSIKRTEVKKR